MIAPFPGLCLLVPFHLLLRHEQLFNTLRRIAYTARMPDFLTVLFGNPLVCFQTLFIAIDCYMALLWFA